MALAVSPRPTTPITDPTAPLVAAIAHFESTLTDEQRRDYRNASTRPAASDVIAFVTKVDSDNQAQTRMCVASRLCTFLNAAQQFTNIVDTFVSANPAIAALVWGSIKFTIVVASNMVSFFDKLTSMIMSIGKFCPVYKKFEQLFPDSVDLQHALCEYYAAVVRLCVKVIEMSQRPATKQLLTSIWNTFESEFKTSRDDLDQAMKVVDLHTRLAAEQAANRTAKLLVLERQENRKYRALGSAFRAEARKERNDAHRWRLQELNRWRLKMRLTIRDNLSTIDHLKAWKHIYQQRAPATAEWLQNDSCFLEWKADKNTAVLWCPGTLGIGKSVLASNIVAHLQQTQTSRDVVCYYFCDAENRASLSARMILGTLAQQMMSTNIENAEDDELDRLSQLTKNLEARDIVKFLLPHLSQNQDHYLVLDGLDEIEHEDIDVLARSINQLCKSRVRGLKIMFTGRPELRQYLFQFKSFDYQASVVKSRLMADIEQYSEITLGRCLEEGTLKLGDPILILRIQDTLRTVSEGIFLWTRLFIEEICAQISDNAILEALRNPPRKISQLIDMKMTRLRGHAAADQALRLLRHCGVLRRPLEMDEYQELLSISIGQQSFDRGSLPNDMAGIIAACCGLVSVDPEESTVRYIHHSIRQYLFSSKGVDGDVFDENDSDTYIGELCLTYLDFNDFKRQLTKQNASANIPIRPAQLGLLPTAQPGSIAAWMARKLLQHSSELRNLSVGEMEQKIHELTGGLASSRRNLELRQLEFRFLNYARQYWIHHLKQLDKDRSARSWRLFCETIADETSLANKSWRTEGLPDSTNSVDDIVNWSVRNDHHALLLYVVCNKSEALKEKSKEEILCCTTATSLLSTCLVSAVIRRANCQRNTIIRGLIHAIESEQKDCVDIYSTAYNPSDSWELRRYKLYVLAKAADRGYLDIVDRLLTAGAKVNAAAIDYGHGGWTALQLAADGGHLDVVERLLTAAADVNAVAAEDGKTALEAAAGGGHLEMVERLLAAGADVNAAAGRRQYGKTALQAAAGGGYLEVVERLLGVGADVNAAAGRRQYGKTALHAAAGGGYLEVVERLLAAGADVNAAGSRYFGKTALQLAADGGHLEVVERLLAAGVNVNAAAAEDGKTALEAAAGKGHLEVVERLLAAGADVRFCGSGHNAMTVIHAAADGGYLEVVERLLAAGADVNAAGSRYFGKTALQLAADGGHLEVVERLLEAGADVNAAATEDGITAIEAAADGGHLEVVERLLAAGANVRVSGSGYSTMKALQPAANSGNLEVVDALIAAGADVRVSGPGYNAWTVLQAAADSGHPEAADTLLGWN